MSNVGVPKSFFFTNASTPAQHANVKATPGRVRSVLCTNVSATARFVKIYDKATAGTTSDHPVLVIAVPASGTVTVAGVDVRTTLGVSVGITGAAADNDATALTAANDVKVIVTYQ